MIRKEIENLIKSALDELKKDLGDFSIKEISLEHPENQEHGDYSTNIAFALAKQFGKNPQDIAEAIKSKIQSSKSKMVRQAHHPEQRRRINSNTKILTSKPFLILEI